MKSDNKLPEVVKPEVHDKRWGREEWIVNNKLYCGKILVIKKGWRSSLHHHKLKDETFYIAKGKVRLERGEDSEKVDVLNAGDCVRIFPDTWHRFTGLEDSEIIEISTQHFDSDSHRKVMGCKVDVDKV